MNAMLTEFTLANFKSYSTSRLPLGSLTVLIGANAAGKSNALEGLRFLSWLAQGQKLSSIQYAVNSADRVVRGRVNDLCHRGESNFTIGCRLDSTEWNQLDITLHFVEQVKAAFNGEAPWQPTAFPDTKEIMLWIDQFPDLAGRNKAPLKSEGTSFGDMSIIQEFHKSCNLFKMSEVFIWSLDGDLKNYRKMP